MDPAIFLRGQMRVRGGSNHYSETERAIIRLLWKDGAPEYEDVAAAAEVMRRTVGALRSMATSMRIRTGTARARYGNQRRTKSVTTTPRNCLMCGGEFDSEGIYERVCGRCKGTKRWKSGMDATLSVTW